MPKGQKKDRSWKILRALDLGCGIGGTGVGLARANFAVAGVDSNPVALEIYREVVGPAWLGRIEDAHPPVEKTQVVWMDLPGTPHVPDISLGSLAWNAVRIALEGNCPVVVFSCSAFRYEYADDALRELLWSAGYYPQGKVLAYEDFGIPQYRSKLYVVGFQSSVAEWRWNWPRRTHAPPGKIAHDLKKPRYVTVRDVSDLPYDKPSPPITLGERKSCRRGDGGGTRRSLGWTASERLAASVGRGAWGDKAAMAMDLLLKLQGLPRWVFKVPLRRVYPLVCGATPPAISKVIGEQIKVALI